MEALRLAKGLLVVNSAKKAPGISFYLSSLVQEENLLLALFRSHDFVGLFIASK